MASQPFSTLLLIFKTCLMSPSFLRRLQAHLSCIFLIHPFIPTYHYIIHFKKKNLSPSQDLRSLGTRSYALFIFLSPTATSAGHMSGVKRKLLKGIVLARPRFWELETAPGGRTFINTLQFFLRWVDRHSNGPQGPVTTPQSPLFSSKEKCIKPWVF